VECLVSPDGNNRNARFVGLMAFSTFLRGVHCTSVGLANGKRKASVRMILQLGAVLRGISPLIWRRLWVPSDASVAQLHGWDLERGWHRSI
jgi:hypothetical protein